MLTELFSSITAAFTQYLPSMATGIYTMFVHIFCEYTTTEAGAISVTGLNALGETAAAFIGIGIVAGLVATVLGVLRLRKRKGSKKRRRK